MAHKIIMPKMGLGLSDARIVEWFKAEGDVVEAGEPLFAFETDKASVDAEAQTSGILGKILIQNGDSAASGTVVGLIVQEGEPLEVSHAADPSMVDDTVTEQIAPAAEPHEPAKVQDKGSLKASPAAKRLAKANQIDITTVEGTGRDGRISLEDVQRVIDSRAEVPVVTAENQMASERTAKILASPIAKRLAEANGIDLASITGSGREGRITQKDVQQIIDSSRGDQLPPSGEELIAIEGVRATIAERMASSVQQTAPVTLHTEVDATRLVDLRQAYKRVAPSAGTGVPSYNALLISMVGQALREHPHMNARQDGKYIRLLEQINIGLAVDTERGLLVVVVKDVNEKTPLAIDSEVIELAERALAGTATVDDLSGSTFTITNLGAFGIDRFTPIINPPEMGILGVGRIVDKPIVIGGEVLVRPMITLSLTFDHRLIDGAPAAKFLQRIAQLIDKGE
ncbi:MAG: 2-oxo acid dehydrogenase subunit E2 [Chloroflexota bacterium]